MAPPSITHNSGLNSGLNSAISGPKPSKLEKGRKQLPPGIALPCSEQILRKLSVSSSEDERLTGFEMLQEGIRTILGPSSGIDSDDVNVEDLMDIMTRYHSIEKEWKEYALEEPSRGYTRNGIDNINDKANLLLLVWNPGKGSCIHDHADAHCIMKILKGTLCETLYDWPSQSDNEDEERYEDSPNGPMKIIRETTLTEQKVAYMSDKLGLHRIRNPSGSEVAVSLHLYTPPWAAHYGCSIFDESTGKSSKVNMSNLYSWRGELQEKSGGDSC